MRLRVDFEESPETGEIVYFCLVDERGRVVFRFGAADECERQRYDEREQRLYCVSPDDVGLKSGDWVTLEKNET